MLKSRRHLALALIIVVVYGACFTAIKVGLTFAPPLRFAALRGILAGTAILAVLGVTGRPLLPPHRLWGGVAALALIGTSLGYAAMFMSPGRTGAGISSVLGNTGPIITIALAAAFLDERLTVAKTWSLVLGMIGATLIAWPAFADPTRPGGAGVLLPLASAAAAAGATVLLKRLNVGPAVAQVAAWQLVIGALPLAALSAALERADPIRWTGSFVAVLSFLALVGTAFALWLWYWLVQREDVGQLSLLFFLVPLFGLALAAAVFGERIGVAEAFGVGLTLTGIAAILISGREETSADDDRRPGGPGRRTRREVTFTSSQRSIHEEDRTFGP